MSNKDIYEDFIDANVVIDDYTTIVERGIHFREDTLESWSNRIKLPLLHDKMSYVELYNFNIQFVNVNEIIMTNYAFAKSYYEIAKARYEAVVRCKQQEIIDAADQNKRVPGADTLERLASLKCINEFNAMNMMSVCFEFWRIQHEKIKLIDSRLTNINYTFKGHNA
jgi:hypothetical protein